ncbi:MAG: Uma2 family endonuclease [Candidatus Rokuibacteriota bacterium]
MAVAIQRRLFTTEDYHRMAEAAVFAAEDRVELIDGEVVEMSPIGLAHATCVRRLTNLLAHRVGERALLDVQNPLRLGERSEPQPDLMLLRPRDDDYADALPTAADVLLAIEVADRSLAFDREVKLSLYARHGVPEVWLVDLASRSVGVHRDPSGEAYRESRTAGSGDRLTVEALAGLEFRVDEILPIG